MKVTVSVGGRFHGFYLAKQLLRENYLERLITSYPKFEVVKYGIPKDKISSLIFKEVAERGWRKLPAFIRNSFNIQFLVSDAFDKQASWNLPQTDIFVGWPSFMLHSLRKAKSRGAIIVAEHCSSHILYQGEILKEEYERWGTPIHPLMLPHPKIIEKELAELEEADYIFPPSSFVTRSLLEAGVPQKKIFQVPYGVDLSAFKQVPKKDNVFRVVFAGGMSLRKGVQYLLQAFSELKLPGAELWLIGTMNEEMEPFFKKYAGNYKYLGHIPQPKLHEYYSQGSVFAIASIEEGMAYVQPQAMACGLPVIATTNSGGEDIVRDGEDGFIIPIRDVEALKEKILYMYEHPEERERMGRSAKERVSNGFTWDDYGEKVVSAYKKILATK